LKWDLIRNFPEVHDLLLDEGKLGLDPHVTVVAGTPNGFDVLLPRVVNLTQLYQIIRHFTMEIHHTAGKVSGL
jgi:hypothetical protein